MKLTSTSSGTLWSTCSPGAKRVATRIGRAAFFAPLMGTVPCSETPPSMTNLSMEHLRDRTERRDCARRVDP